MPDMLYNEVGGGEVSLLTLMLHGLVTIASLLLYDQQCLHMHIADMWKAFMLQHCIKCTIHSHI